MVVAGWRTVWGWVRAVLLTVTTSSDGLGEVGEPGQGNRTECLALALRTPDLVYQRKARSDKGRLGLTSKR